MLTIRRRSARFSGSGREGYSMKQFKFVLSLLIALCASFTTLNVARADVKLPNVFGDHMVLQRGQKIPVWGTADPGEKVTVKIESQSRSALADQGGKWRVTLNPIESMAPLLMHVEGKN